MTNKKTPSSTSSGTVAPSQAQVLLAAMTSFKGKSTIKLIIPTDKTYKILKYQAGIVTFKKDYSNGAPDYVTLVNLEKAGIRSLTGTITNPGTGAGVFGGNNPTISRKHLDEFWSQGVSKWGNNLYAVVNCGFFSTNFDPTTLAFPLKEENKHISDGYGSNNEYQNPFQLKTLSFQNKKATIDTFNNANSLGSWLHAANGLRNIAGGLDKNANKGPNNFVGRTFIGLVDSNQDGINDIALLFNSSFASQNGAVNVLTNDFTCKPENIIMFDGGGSTQLIMKNQSYISSSRTIPHALAIISNTKLTVFP